MDSPAGRPWGNLSSALGSLSREPQTREDLPARESSVIQGHTQTTEEDGHTPGPLGGGKSKGTQSRAFRVRREGWRISSMLRRDPRAEDMVVLA